MKKLFRHPVVVMCYAIVMIVLILAFLSTGSTAPLWVGFALTITMMGLAGVGKPPKSLLEDDEEPKVDVGYKNGGVY